MPSSGGLNLLGIFFFMPSFAMGRCRISSCFYSSFLGFSRSWHFACIGSGWWPPVRGPGWRSGHRQPICLPTRAAQQAARMKLLAF